MSTERERLAWLCDVAGKILTKQVPVESFDTDNLADDLNRAAALLREGTASEAKGVGPDTDGFAPFRCPACDNVIHLRYPGHEVTGVGAGPNPTEREPVWRPIEEAPKDGTEVLLLVGAGPVRAAVVGRWLGRGRQDWVDSWDHGPLPKAFHFMPLPAPPEGEG